MQDNDGNDDSKDTQRDDEQEINPYTREFPLYYLMVINFYAISLRYVTLCYATSRCNIM